MENIKPTRVERGQDRFNEPRGMGISALAFKVGTQETNGGLFVLEQTMHAKGGPPRHIHPDQEEWFYAMEGSFVVEVAEEHFELTAGDSILAPRGVPHTWAFVGEGIGRFLVAFTPAGKMEAFFREVTKANAMPSQDPAVWLAHGMQVVGPPLAIK